MNVALGLGAAGLALGLYSFFVDSPPAGRALGGTTANSVYSPAQVGGHLVYTAGQVALDPVEVKKGNKGLVGAGDVSKEARQALTNLKSVVESSGSSMAKVMKCNVYLTSMDHYAAFNEVYTDFFGIAATGAAPPARTCVAVHQLPLGALVEIEAIARV
eukprot:CAMPEP_0205822226 /NCGR_PEP_ID=MMETSP0206-20130828/11647_1 /ASSEMBLY_ACC=CAM_ASM_000279 /TAXON_ID=36767 /ORGANISM="Euplotes focardii, Strain TN1" /LENGTH=158 /DNA_ID=CAMNT_0053118327 /DNA_START=64 /DNA_END=540 /DNA_ORIENTATION=+